MRSRITMLNDHTKKNTKYLQRRGIKRLTNLRTYLAFPSNGAKNLIELFYCKPKHRLSQVILGETDVESTEKVFGGSLSLKKEALYNSIKRKEFVFVFGFLQYENMLRIRDPLLSFGKENNYLLFYFLKKIIMFLYYHP